MGLPHACRYHNSSAKLSTASAAKTCCLPCVWSCLADNSSLCEVTFSYQLHITTAEHICSVSQGLIRVEKYAGEVMAPIATRPRPCVGDISI